VARLDRHKLLMPSALMFLLLIQAFSFFSLVASHSPDYIVTTSRFESLFWVPLGQNEFSTSFTTDASFDAVLVNIGTYDRINNGTVSLVLDCIPYDASCHRESHIDASSIANGALNKFSFSLIRLSKPSAFKVILTQPDFRYGNEVAIMVWPQADQPYHLTVSDTFHLNDMAMNGYTAMAIQPPEGSGSVDQLHVERRFMEAMVSILFFALLFTVVTLLAVRRPDNFVEAFSVLCLLCFFYWLYFHSSSQATYHFVDYCQGTYYKDLAHAFESGHLGVPAPDGSVPPDWSPYAGTNYLYFGPLPAVFWVIVESLHVEMTMSELTLLFSIVNLIVFYIFMRNVTEYMGLGVSWTQAARLVFTGVYGIGPLYFLSSTYFVYQTAIIFGSTFLLLSSILFFAYLNSQTSHKHVAIFASSLCLSAAFLSRVNLVACAVPFLAFVTWKELSNNRRTGIQEQGICSHEKAVSLIAFLIPILSAGFISAIYNVLRFGNPFEFGSTYQHAGPGPVERVTHYGYASTVYIWRNLYHLTLLIPRLSLDVPFVNYCYASGAGCPNWLVGEYPKLVQVEWGGSVFFSSPILLFSFFSIGYLFARHASKRMKTHRLNILVIAMLLVFAAGPPLMNYGYSRRYLQDFYPFLTLLSYLGFVCIWETLGAKRAVNLQRALCVIVFAALGWAFLIAFDLNVQLAFNSDFARALSIYREMRTFTHSIDASC